MKKKTFYLNTGSTAMPSKGTKVFIKGGKSIVSSGKSWTTTTNYALGGLEATTYTSLETALTKCAASSTCKGVVKNKKGKYQLATKTTKTKKIGFTSYAVGSSITVLSDFAWTVKSGYTLKGYATKTTYKTLAKALAACAKTDSCNGVTKEGKDPSLVCVCLSVFAFCFQKGSRFWRNCRVLSETRYDTIAWGSVHAPVAEGLQSPRPL